MSPREAEERLDTRTSSDRLQVALHNQRYEFVLQNLARLDFVLEIGTGEGNLSVLLAPRCGRYVGLEFDADTCLRVSQRLGGAYPIVRGDARKLPFEPRSFSGIVCLEVLEHLGDFRAGIRNIQRCLRDDGRAILSVPYRRRGGASDTNVYHLYEPAKANWSPRCGNAAKVSRFITSILRKVRLCMPPDCSTFEGRLACNIDIAR